LGEYVITPDQLGSDSVVYSFGVGKHIAFDLGIIQLFNVTLHAFDPTPVSCRWIRTQQVPSRFVFHDFGVAGHDGQMHFYPPQRVDSAHYSSIKKSPGASAVREIEAPVFRLGTIMRRLGHNHIDLLKIDIEGAEYAVLADMVKSGLDVRQVAVEFHHNYPGLSIEHTVTAVEQLRQAGFRLFHIGRRSFEMSFIR